MANVVPERAGSLIEAVTGASELGEFLASALGYGKARAGAADAAVFFFSGATETLELRRKTRSAEPRPGLKPGQGIAGIAYQEGRPILFSGEKLEQAFVSWGGIGCKDLAAIACLPVFFEDKTQAIFCFDFKKDDPYHLTPSEREERMERLSSEFGAPGFGRALWRVRSHQAQLDIRAAGDGPARQRQAVADFLERLLSSFKTSNFPQPCLAYVQLVDRRRDTVRTVQGVGLPLSFQMSLSHSLRGNDIQAHVVRERQPLLIVGRHPLFDKAVFDLFGHTRFVRLWLPLFPLPLSWVASRPGYSLVEAMQDILVWSDGEIGKEWLQVTGRWNEAVIPGIPPAELVYGTLELGYLRKDMSKLELAPFSRELATWSAAKSYEASNELFRATLAGSLDTIGKAVAEIAWPHRTILSVAMPDWRTPQDRSYPAETQWKAAIPRSTGPVFPPPNRPAVIRLDPPCLSEEPASLRSRLADQAEASARVALHLDDHATDLYTLIEETDASDDMSTGYPDPRLDEILQEICREAGAERCSHFLFDEERSGRRQQDGPTTRSWRLVGLRQAWPQPSADARWKRKEEDLAARTAAEQVPMYEVWEEPSPSVAALPLALTSSSQAVIVLHFAGGTQLTDHRRRDLEGRVTRWLYRLSLRHFLLAGGFSRLMQRLRVSLGEAARAAAQVKDARCLASFSPMVLANVGATMKTLATLMTICSRPETGAPQLECLWSSANGEGAGSAVESATFVVASEECTPFEDKGKSVAPILWPPGAPERGGDGRTASKYLRQHAAARAGERSGETAGHLGTILERLGGTAAHDSTVVLIPFASSTTRQDLADNLVGGALILVLAGHHDILYGQRQLLVELGDLVGKSVADMRALDVAAIAKTQAERIERATTDLSGAQNDDEVFGLFLRNLGHSKAPASGEAPIRWALCEHAVVWLLSPGYRELVARSGRGMGLEALAELTVIDPRNHPFLRQEIQPEQVPRHEQPRLHKGFRLRTFRLDEAEADPLLVRYASVAGCRWLLSFPLMHTNQQVIGVVDCLVPQPLRPEEQNPTEQVMRRLAAQACSALDHCRFERLLEFSRVISEEANQHLVVCHAHDAYRAIVERVRTELGTTHCDLFHDHDGFMVLQASTRWSAADDTGKMHRHWLRARKDGDVLGSALASGGTRIAHAMSTPEDLGHMTEALRELLAEDYRHERMAIPLLFQGSQQAPPQGMLYLRGPLSRAMAGHADHLLKKSGLLTAEHRRHARNIAVVVHRVAMMARLLERQSWLVDELQHALGQPLQGLSEWVAKAKKSLVDCGAPDDQVTALTKGFDRGFAFVHEARQRLAVYAKMSQVVDPTDVSEAQLERIIRDYAGFFEPLAQRKGCQMVLRLKPTPSVPAHESLLRAAISNLFDNAIKYSYQKRMGDIVVTMDENESGEIKIGFENFGVGIPSNDLERIFEPYYRSRVPDAKVERRGCGIGLAIVKHAIENVHGGQVKAESVAPRDTDPKLPPAEIAKLPHKTTFTITLSRAHLAKLVAHAPGPEREPHA
jgi:signal transduction histidine kinase